MNEDHSQAEVLKNHTFNVKNCYHFVIISTNVLYTEASGKKNSPAVSIRAAEYADADPY